MKYSFGMAGLMALGVAAHPLTTRQSTNIDTTILQFALTLEHLENVFYHGALQNFTLQDFENAGYSATYYNNLKQISFDEQSHVQLLSGALSAAGVTPVQACQYKFPYTDVNSFITLSSVLEGVGTSAYLAGAPLITSKGYLTVAGSILVTEALHTSYQRAAIGEVPMANPYGTPLDPMSVYTLAASFITSCPAGNPPLPFTSFPALSYTPNPACYCEEPDCSPSQAVKRDEGDDEWQNWSQDEYEVVYVDENGNEISGNGSGSGSGSGSDSGSGSGNGYGSGNGNGYGNGNGNGVSGNGNGNGNGYGNGNGNGNGKAPNVNYCAPPSPGTEITLTAASTIPAGSYVTFVSGLAVVSVQPSISGNMLHVTIPSVAAGQTYVFITNADVETTFVDSAVLFGPAIVEVNPPAAAIDYSVV